MNNLLYILPGGNTPWMSAYTAITNLQNEGFHNFECKIVKSGDVMQDGALYYRKFARKPESIANIDKNYVLCTIHRAENTDDEIRLQNIFSALNEMSFIPSSYSSTSSAYPENYSSKGYLCFSKRVYY